MFFPVSPLCTTTWQQDFRLYTIVGVQDATICNDEKLQSGSTASFVRSCKHFLDWEIFRKGSDWPSVIMAPSHMINSEDAANLAIEVRETRIMFFRWCLCGVRWGQMRHN